MAEYKFFIIGRTGHIAAPFTVVECADDLAAIRQGQSVIDGRDLEIWQDKRLVTYLVPQFFAGEMHADPALESPRLY